MSKILCGKTQSRDFSNSLISDNGLQFDSRDFREFCSDLGIKNKYSTPVYPQSNGQAEAVNKIIVNGLKKRLDGANGKWGRRFAQRFMGIPNNAQEIYRRNTVFLDVWGRSCDTGQSKPMQSQVEGFKTVQNEGMIMERLDLLKEHRKVTTIQLAEYQQELARRYNQDVKTREFSAGDLVLRKAVGNM